MLEENFEDRLITMRKSITSNASAFARSMKKILLTFITMLLFAMPIYASFKLTDEEKNLFIQNGYSMDDVGDWITTQYLNGKSEADVDFELREMIDSLRAVTPTAASDTENVSKQKQKGFINQDDIEAISKYIKRNGDFLAVILAVPILFASYFLYIKRKLKKIPVNNYTILGVVSFGFLSFVAISQPYEYGFYQVLRWLVCSFSAWTSVKIYQKTPKSFWLMAFVALAVIFNPVLPLKFEDEVWIPIDIVTALIFIAYSIKSVQKTRC